MLVVRRHRRNPIRQPNRIATEAIGCPIRETPGNRAVRPDNKAKRAMVKCILGFVSERGIARQRVFGRCGPDRTLRSPLSPPAVEIQEKKSLP
jgi:hypothetical protein